MIHTCYLPIILGLVDPPMVSSAMARTVEDMRKG
jgi:hypothetical protein